MQREKSRLRTPGLGHYYVHQASVITQFTNYLQFLH